MRLVSACERKNQPHLSYRYYGNVDGVSYFEEIVDTVYLENEKKRKIELQQKLDYVEPIRGETKQYDKEYNTAPFVSRELEYYNTQHYTEYSDIYKETIELGKELNNIICPAEVVLERIDLKRTFNLPEVAKKVERVKYDVVIDPINKTITLIDNKNNSKVFQYAHELKSVQIDQGRLIYREVEKFGYYIYDNLFDIELGIQLDRKQIRNIEYNVDPSIMGGSEKLNVGVELVVYNDFLIERGLAAAGYDLGLSTGPGRYEIDNEPQYIYDKQYDNSNSTTTWYTRVEPFRTDNWWQDNGDFSATTWSTRERSHLIGDNVLIAGPNTSFVANVPAFLPRDGGDPVAVTITNYVTLPESGLNLALLNEPADERITRSYLWPFEDVTPNFVFNGRTKRVVQDFTSPAVDNTQTLGTSKAARLVPGKFKSLSSDKKTFFQEGVNEYNAGTFTPPASGYYVGTALGDIENASYVIDKFTSKAMIVSLYDDYTDNSGVFLGSQAVRDEIDAQLATWGVARNKYFTE